MEVRPRRAFSSACCTTRSLSVSRALVASSRSSSAGSRTRARQIATRCFCPPESLLPRGPTSISKPCPDAESRKLRLAIRMHSNKCCSVMVSPASVSSP
mmetsp:Transcript_134539/g.335695  ORF Transcript_134539/g.335695 Transcript_134539/m.335695 type:complete len:99 (-) Transcript_134539:3620-3916(-)